MVALAARAGFGWIYVRSARGSAIGSGPWWRSLLVVLATVGLATAAVPATVAAAPSSSGGSCSVSARRAINGPTFNRTDVTLRRLYQKEGYGSDCEHKPAELLRGRATNLWCNQSRSALFTTVAMKMGARSGAGMPTWSWRRSSPSLAAQRSNASSPGWIPRRLPVAPPARRRPAESCSRASISSAEADAPRQCRKRMT